MLSGILTALALAAYVGIVFWAYSKKQQARFDAAAQLPLQDDDQQPGERHG